MSNLGAREMQNAPIPQVPQYVPSYGGYVAPAAPVYGQRTYEPSYNPFNGPQQQIYAGQSPQTYVAQPNYGNNYVYTGRSVTGAQLNPNLYNNIGTIRPPALAPAPVYRPTPTYTYRAPVSGFGR
jgi:hypothetical protein